MNRFRLPACATLGLTILACAGESSGGGLTAPSVPQFAASTFGVCNDNAPEPANFDSYWDCHKTIYVRGPWSSAWNSALQNIHTPGIPIFADAPAGGAFDLDVVVTGQGSVWCGRNVGFHRIEMGLPGSSSCSEGPNTGPFNDVLIHEMSHTIGFRGGAGHKSGWQGVSDECATQLDPGEPPGSLVCQHIVEIVYAAYGFRSGIPPDFWSRPIVTGVNGSSPITLEIGEKDTIHVSTLFFANSQTPSQPLGGVDLSFNAQTGNGVINVSDSVITAADEGTDTVRIQIAGGLNPAYQVGSLMAAFGTQVPVTVTAPPPGPFRVTDITGAPQPITNSGSYSLHATVINPPSASPNIKWRIEYSVGPNGVADTIQTGWGPNSYSLSVHPGSYNIRVTATPRDADGSPMGAAFTEDFPVCTGGGGGGGPWLAGTDPGNHPNAKQGC